MRADQVILEPILSEKSNLAREAECKKYTFRVDPKANKYEIMKACKELFGVNCTRTKICVTFYRRSLYRRITTVSLLYTELGS